mmetsp:Transcript_17145/g.42585  ORF Transcript_17145/g.42585 Transcript_17145/m.42585 type:complete len:319 (+) Transcript_17145:1026-1982(+)
MQSAVTPRAATGWHVVVLRGRSPRPQRRSERVVVCVGPHPRAQQQAALHTRRRGELGSACARGRAGTAARHPQRIPVVRGDRSVAHTAFSLQLVIASVDHPVRRQANARAVRQCHCMHQERLRSFSHRWHRIPVCSKLLLQVPARWPEPCFDPQTLVLRSLNLARLEKGAGRVRTAGCLAATRESATTACSVIRGAEPTCLARGIACTASCRGGGSSGGRVRADISMGGEGEDSASLRRRWKGDIGVGVGQPVWRRQVGARGARLRALRGRVAQLAIMFGPNIADEAAAALVLRHLGDSGIGGDRVLHLAENFTGPLK